MGISSSIYILLGYFLIFLGLSECTDDLSKLSNYNYDYNEQLIIQPFPRSRLLTSFEFQSRSEKFPKKLLHNKSNSQIFQYGSFPRSLGQILDQTKSRELHLRFSQGWWDAEGWGSPPRNGSFSGGIGVEVWAATEGETVEDALPNWFKLVNSLSGLFCASLNFIDSAQTVTPLKSFQVSEQNDIKLHVFRGSLPREPVCTENLTPFIKLLPCKGKAGIASLLDGHKIFDAQWQGMAIDAVLICDESEKTCQWQLTQVIDAIIDVPRSLRRKISPVPRPVPEDKLRCDTSKSYSNPYTCFPLGEDLNVSWLLSDIFGREIAGSCSINNNKNTVSINAPENWQIYIKGDDKPDAYFSTKGNKFSLKSGINYDFSFKTPNSSQVIERIEPPVYLERSFTGYGQDRGGLRTEFKNVLDKTVKFVYLEVLPWYMKPYIHTLTIEELSASGKSLVDIESSDVLLNIDYILATDRKRPTQIEIELLLKPNSSVVLNYDFDKTLLFIEEYPPDANHGFEIPPGVLTVIPDNFHSNPFTIRTTSLLLTLPTPDFSMPYNVIILTCTVMALAFGSIFNLIVKKIVTDDEADAVSRANPLRIKILNAIQKFKSKFEKPQRGPFPYTPREVRGSREE